MPSVTIHEDELKFQKICCINETGFIVSFKVFNESRELGESESYFPLGKAQIVDLADCGLEIGTPIHPLVHPVYGVDKAGSSVRYFPNGRMATYIIRGTPFKYSVELFR